VLQAIRQNGINQQEYVTKNPSLGSSGGSEAAPTTYAIAPNLKAPLSMQAAVGVEHRFGKGVTVSTTGISTRAACTNSIPTTSTTGTYDYSTGVGVRPNGINENIYQYQSGGTSIKAS
jgi:hypothetical protein